MSLLILLSSLSLITVYFTTADEDNDKKSLVWVADGDDEDGSYRKAFSHSSIADVQLENLPEIHRDRFVPKQDWTEIMPGQTVPSGLHYRINLQTGKKEAKLLHSAQMNRHSKNPERLLVKTMKDALKNIENGETFETIDEEAKNVIKQKFRPYDELKRDFKAMNVEVKSDLEVITSLLKEYRQTDCSAERKLEILSEFEYLVHQFDNAINFVNENLNGLNIVRNALNNSDEKFRAVGALIMGAAAQNNPEVKLALYDNGFLHQIVGLLARETKIPVRHKLLFALSAVLLNFPLAQQKFVELGGLDNLMRLWSERLDLKESIKIVTLLSNLLEERRDSERLLRSRESISSQSSLLDNLRNTPVCNNVGLLLTESVVMEPDNLDAQEKILRLLHVSVYYGLCDESNIDWLRPQLLQLKLTYENMLINEPDDSFFVDLLRKCDDVLNHSYKHNEL